MTTKKYNSIFLFALLAMTIVLVSWPVVPQSLPVLAASFGPLPNIQQVAAGYTHTCVLTTLGGVKCWGSNANGQLGNGTNEDKNAPVDVNNLRSSVALLAAGGWHTCALTITGEVKCWGANLFGQLGDGATDNKNDPVDVSGLGSNVIALTAGEFHTCAVTTTGGAKCWGYNQSGQLGDGTKNDKGTAVDVSGLSSGIADLAAGDFHTCALTTTGGVKCWGDNLYGQLGNGITGGQKTTPVDVNGLSSGVTAISNGAYHTCALMITKEVKCWGRNGSGQLGDNSTIEKNTPTIVSALGSDIAALNAGAFYTCALTTTGGVKCWGNNSYGQLGDGTTSEKYIPVAVSGLSSGVRSISAGKEHTCALTTEGIVKCWGYNDIGQLGNGITGNNTTPVDTVGLNSGVTAILTGGNHACALTTVGGVTCWGLNNFGQLGDATYENKNTPVDVSGLSSGITAFTAGWGHTCVLMTIGSAKCWGDNRSGQLGDATNQIKTTPTDINSLGSAVTKIDAGGEHTCALTNASGVKCWGNNRSGQLGDGTTVSKNTPVDVSALTSEVTAISVGANHTCAVTTAGIVKCWGENRSGQLGDGSTDSKTTPVNVSGLNSTVKAISAGQDHTCALTTQGGVKCWGNNFVGQLGDGTEFDRKTPVDVSGLPSGVTALSAGYNHTCAMTTTGGVKCWGANLHGQLGDGSTVKKKTPVDVSGLNSGIVAISADYSHTCALTIAGGVRCWGDNSNGQLGDGNAWHTTPVDVVEAEIATPTPTTTPTATPMTTPAATTTPTPTAEPTVVTVRVEGKVLDQETQTGIPDVLMILSSTSRHAVTASSLLASATVYTTTTGLDGTFVFAVVKLGTYTLSGAKAGVVIQSPAPLVISGSGTVPIAPLQATKASAMLYLPLVTKR